MQQTTEKMIHSIQGVVVLENDDKFEGDVMSIDEMMEAARKFGVDSMEGVQKAAREMIESFGDWPTKDTIELHMDGNPIYFSSKRVLYVQVIVVETK